MTGMEGEVGLSTAHAELLIDAGLEAEWRMFVDRAPRWKTEPGGDCIVQVALNMFGLACLRRPSDYLALEKIAERHGKQRLALTQHLISSALETADDQYLGSRLVHGLAPPFYGPVLDSHFDKARAEALADVCTRTAMLFMLAGAHEVEEGPDIETPDAFLHHFLHEHLPQWRSQIARYADNPWSSYARHLETIAGQAGMAEFGPTIRRFVAMMRMHLDDRDRGAVAAEIKKTIARSGISQAEFARRIGTSPSRLSSYCTGSTTPSAATFLRIRRYAAGLSSAHDGRAPG